MAWEVNPKNPDEEWYCLPFDEGDKQFFPEYADGGASAIHASVKQIGDQWQATIDRFSGPSDSFVLPTATFSSKDEAKRWCEENVKVSRVLDRLDTT